MVRALVANGSLFGGVFETADCQKTLEELSAKGVSFLQNQPSLAPRISVSRPPNEWPTTAGLTSSVRITASK